MYWMKWILQITFRKWLSHFWFANGLLTFKLYAVAVISRFRSLLPIRVIFLLFTLFQRRQGWISLSCIGLLKRRGDESDCRTSWWTGTVSISDHSGKVWDENERCLENFTHVQDTLRVCSRVGSIDWRGNGMKGWRTYNPLIQVIVCEMVQPIISVGLHVVRMSQIASLSNRPPPIPDMFSQASS